MSKKKIIEDIPETDEIEETGDMPEITEDLSTKYDKMLNYLRESPDGFFINVYRLGDRNKRSFVTRFENIQPDPVKDIQAVYGGGNYRFYLFIIDEKGKYIFKDTSDLNIEPPLTPPVNDTVKASGTSRTDVLQEMRMMSEILGNTGGQKESSGMNDILLKMMENQNHMSENFMKMQLESERRMSEMIERMNSKKSNVTELLEIADAVNGLRGDSNSEKSVIEKIVDNPIFQPIIGNMMSGVMTPAVQPAPAPVPVEKAKPDVNTIIDIVISKMPQAYIESVNVENAEAKINKMVKDNPDSLDLNLATLIISKILQNKGVK